jgi:ABC-2 type transport system ATP-binding protein
MKGLNSGGLIKVELAAPHDEVRTRLQEVTGVAAVTVEQVDAQFVQATVESQPGIDPREQIYWVASKNGWTLRELRRARTTLEDVFVQITHEEDEAEEERRESRRSLLR